MRPAATNGTASMHLTDHILLECLVCFIAHGSDVTCFTVLGADHVTGGHKRDGGVRVLKGMTVLILPIEEVN